MSPLNKLKNVAITTLVGISTLLPLKYFFNYQISKIKPAVSINQAYAGSAKAEELDDRAQAAYMKNDYKTALELFKQELVFEPKDVSIYAQIGDCLTSLGRPQEALKYLNTGISINPEYGLLFTNLACAYERLGDYKKAKELIQHSLKLKHNKNQRIQPEFQRTYDRIMAY